MSHTVRRVTIAIPTYGRDAVLVDTIQHVLAQDPPAAELLVLDQTPRHSPEADATLRELHDAGRIRWLRLDEPSVPKSMNRALREAAHEIVLFLDDDVVPAERLVEEHARGYDDESVWAVVGQVLQPGQAPADVRGRRSTGNFTAGLDFPFHSTHEATVTNVMAGNLSVRRTVALAHGGFDENFIGVAFRFETEFARRIVAAGGRIVFRPKASVRHLKVAAGGTRSYGNHLTSSSPFHAVGDYYFALRQGMSFDVVRYILRRPVREISTRFHLRHPWWILPKLVGEIRGLTLAIALSRRGPRHLQQLKS